MGFISGVITGLGIAAAAAAWYMSRAGSEFREKYRVDRRLGEFGDEMELRTRDVRANVGAQVEQVRSQAEAQVDQIRAQTFGDNGSSASDTLDDASAEAAEMAADAEAKASRAKKAVKEELSGTE